MSELEQFRACGNDVRMDRGKVVVCRACGHPEYREEIKVKGIKRVKYAKSREVQNIEAKYIREEQAKKEVDNG